MDQSDKGIELITLRAFAPSEFETALKLKEITSDEAIEKYRPRFELTGQWADHYLDCAIDVDGLAVGEAQARFCRFSMPAGTSEIGLNLLPEFQGKGIGTSVLGLLKERLFGENFHRLSGSTDVANVGMQKAFDKAGWRFEGISRHLMPEGEEIPHDYRVYAITKFD